MPILAPLSDFAGVQRDLTVTAYQSANGWVNLFNPTFAVVMGGLAIGRVSYDRWLRFVAPLLLVLAVIVAAALSVAALGGGAPPPAPAAVEAPAAEPAPAPEAAPGATPEAAPEPAAPAGN
jgi:hypothetical protein